MKFGDGIKRLNKIKSVFHGIRFKVNKMLAV